MKTTFYISPTEQATANPDGFNTDKDLTAQGFRRVSFWRWLLHSTDMQTLRSKLPLVILALGAILRIAGTGAAAIWFDESNMIYRAGIPFMTLFSEHSENSGDLLLEIILRPLMAISHSVWLLRLPSMLAGLISLWLIRKLMRRLEFTLCQQCVTAAIVAVLPGILWIAQDARSYGLLSCIFLAALWFAMEGRWLGLLAMCGLTVYIHNTGPLCAITALLIAAYLYPWKIRRILLVGAGSALAWIPAAIHMLNNWVVQQPWQPHLTAAWLVKSSIAAVWPELTPGWFMLAACATLAITLMLLFSKEKGPGRIVSMLAWMLPYVGIISFSLITRGNVVLYRTLTPMLFPFALWLGWELGRAKKIVILPALVWILMLVFGLIFWHPSDRGGHLDQVADQIRSQWQAGDTLLYTTVTVGLPFDYYLNDLPHTWDDTVGHPFLAVPSIIRTALATSTETVTRAWVVIPEDLLITQEERAKLLDLVLGQKPIYRLVYLQAAPIDVFLVEK
jgi:hypothetical protein